MNNVWISIILKSAEHPPIRGILCNEDKDPLLFADQKTAFDFWRAHKNKFMPPAPYTDSTWLKLVRATPQVVREGDPDDYLFNLLDKNERVAVLPKPGFVLYSDSWEHPTQILSE